MLALRSVCSPAPPAPETARSETAIAAARASGRGRQLSRVPEPSEFPGGQTSRKPRALTNAVRGRRGSNWRRQSEIDGRTSLAESAVGSVEGSGRARSSSILSAWIEVGGDESRWHVSGEDSAARRMPEDVPAHEPAGCADPRGRVRRHQETAPAGKRSGYERTPPEVRTQARPRPQRPEAAPVSGVRRLRSWGQSGRRLRSATGRTALRRGRDPASAPLRRPALLQLAAGLRTGR